MDFELLKWGDGTIRLAYWDSLHGKDRIFVLREDDTAAECDDEEQYTPVNLVAALRRLAGGERTQ